MRPMTTACFMSADANTCKRSSLVPFRSSGLSLLMPPYRSKAPQNEAGSGVVVGQGRMYAFRRRRVGHGPQR